MAWPLQVDYEARANFGVMVPGHVQDGISQYIEHGRETGHFLMAVFEGDLFRAAQRADEMNKRMLADIALFLVWHAPSAAVGSPEKVKAWIRRGGLTHMNSTSVEE